MEKNLVIKMRSKSTLNALNLMIKTMFKSDSKNYTMVEVGSYTGESTEIFAQNFKKVYAIDPWECGYDTHNVANSDMPLVESIFEEKIIKHYNNVIKIKNYSENVCNEFEDGNLNFVYLDGNHRYTNVLNDINIWLPKIKSGFYIGGHDYEWKYGDDVKRAVCKVFKKPDKIFSDTSWIKKI